MPCGDYSIAELEEKVVLERKSIQGLFNCCSPYGSKEIFMKACERLGKFACTALVIEGSISKTLQSNEFSSMHPNAVFGTIQALPSSGPGCCCTSCTATFSRFKIMESFYGQTY